jgi:hypothetical protein
MNFVGELSVFCAPVGKLTGRRLESILESKLNPLVILGRLGLLGLGSFVNKFNKDAERASSRCPRANPLPSN